jgi:hypothetical protein
VADRVIHLQDGKISDEKLTIPRSKKVISA